MLCWPRGLSFKKQETQLPTELEAVALKAASTYPLLGTPPKGALGSDILEKLPMTHLEAIPTTKKDCQRSFQSPAGQSSRGKERFTRENQGQLKCRRNHMVFSQVLSTFNAQLGGILTVQGLGNPGRVNEGNQGPVPASVLCRKSPQHSFTFSWGLLCGTTPGSEHS